MPQFFPFFLILFIGLFFSELFYRLHLPLVVALILGGIITGPYGLGLFSPDTTLKLIGEIGLIFLMFMAGLEIKLSTFKEIGSGVLRMVFFNGVIPAILGLGLGLYFGYSLAASFLIGIIFISSSIAVVIPSLEANKLMENRLGKTIIASTVVADVLSLVLLSILLQTQSPTASLPLPLFYTVLLFALIALRWALPRIRWFVFKHSPQGVNLFEWEFQLIFVILLGTVIIFELLGLHSIIAGFFAGFVLSESIKSDVLKGKLRAISYGFFIPVFFVLIGADANIRVFGEIGGAAIWFTVALVFVSVFAKFFGGWIGSRINGFNIKESTIAGAATIPQLSTTLAAVVAGFELGILDEELVAAMIILSIITTLAGPIFLWLAKKNYSPNVSDNLNASIKAT
ncbi:MAG: cation:proton antiporter [Candidatus Spechtbacterales bacterium]|nr:cation:proton antiporter [Candidatus Spechtbacterales bacterium]